MEKDYRDCFAALTMTAIIWDSSKAVDCFTPFAMTANLGAGEGVEKEAVHQSLLNAQLSSASFSTPSQDQLRTVIARRHDEAIC